MDNSRVLVAKAACFGGKGGMGQYIICGMGQYTIGGMATGWNAGMLYTDNRFKYAERAMALRRVTLF